ncbi:MAG: hypothetical protein ACRC0S_06735 [Fusobacteriaceae bacterium]
MEIVKLDEYYLKILSLGKNWALLMCDYIYRILKNKSIKIELISSVNITKINNRAVVLGWK